MTKIPGVEYNYSDHEGVTACLQVQASHTGTKQQHMSVVDLHRQILEARSPLHLAKERTRPKFVYVDPPLSHTHLGKFWRYHYSGGSKGGPNSFNFMQFLRKFGKIVCWQSPPPQSWCSHLEEIQDPPLH